MKTAEEWVNNKSPLDRCSCECETRCEEVELWLKQIQLDAMKEGMRRASEECNVSKYADKWNMNIWDGYKAILTAADQLTIKDI